MKTILFPIAANSISIVVPVYNSWKSAKRCIESVAAQRVLPREIIIVDDGSATSAPNLLKETLKDCNATFIQFSHQGISAARNSGLNLAKGEMVLFIDSDCILKNSTIEELIATVNQHPLNMTFQLRIGGDISRLIGKAEQIYQTAIQDILYQSDGSIRWLNTAGFAVRRQYAKQFLTLFDETIKRGEDTFLLAQLLKNGNPPHYVSNSIVMHSPNLSLFQYVFKAYKGSIHSRNAYLLIKQMGVNIKLNQQQWRQFFQKLCVNASELPFGWVAFVILMMRYIIKAVAKKLHGKSV